MPQTCYTERVTEAGDRVRAAIERHRASVESAQETASALAEQRERETNEAAAARMGDVQPPASSTESEPQ